MLVAFSVAPSATAEDGSVAEAVAAAVAVVRESGLPFELTSMFTTIEGEWLQRDKAQGSFARARKVI
ncbi:hypothetical protein GCM10022237_08900 [Nocardioides ginsengisoli]|uniref:Thiamine-binding protein n=1 Tax=Nocardioides ginsengisoli TaxID=363868 RepID=A0ABW3W2M3_9ACTN